MSDNRRFKHARNTDMGKLTVNVYCIDIGAGIRVNI